MRKLLTFLVALASTVFAVYSPALAWWQSIQLVAVSAGGGCTTTTCGKEGTTVGNNATASSVATAGFSTTNCNNLVIVGASGGDARCPHAIFPRGEGLGFAPFLEVSLGPV